MSAIKLSLSGNDLVIQGVGKDTRKKIAIKKPLKPVDKMVVKALFDAVGYDKITTNTRDLIQIKRRGKLSSEDEQSLIKLLLTDIEVTEDEINELLTIYKK
jgi:hypothetical protein